MIQIIATILISATVTLTSVWGVYNYLPLSALETFQKTQDTEKKLGVSITTILGTDTISSSRTTINNNFTNLNNGKIENASTSLQSLATAPNLTTVGAITAGNWAGNAIGSLYGGTGTTSFALNRVLLGNGTASTSFATSTGSAGQLFTSGGLDRPPFWQSASFDTAADYSNTGLWRFSQPVNASSTLSVATKLNISTSTPNQGVNLAVQGGALFGGATTTLGTLVVASSTESHNGLTYQMPATQSTNEGMATTSEHINDGQGGLSWGIPFSFGATTTNKGFTGNQVINHGLGRIPRMVEVWATAQTDQAGAVNHATSYGIATSTLSRSQWANHSVIRPATSEDADSANETGKIIEMYDAGGGESVAVTLTGLTATTFTLNWGGNDASTEENNRELLWKVQ